jgi:hypothetical protein
MEISRLPEPQVQFAVDSLSLERGQTMAQGKRGVSVKKKSPARLPTSGRIREASRRDLPDSSLVLTPPQAVVEWLQGVYAAIDQYPMPEDERGCALLDCFELTDKIREKFREKARELLLEKPAAIRHWRAETIERRHLSKDTQAVFEAL